MFARSLDGYLRNPQPPSVAVITSQAAQFSVRAELQLEAQRKAVRALAYYNRIAPYAIAENQIEKLGSPQLAILPSPQAFTETAWRFLLNYVSRGGSLLITGPADRDEHWHGMRRAAELKIEAETEPLVYHNAEVRWKHWVIPLTFDQQKQSLLDSLRFHDGSTLKVIPYGQGQIFWAAYPVELAEGSQATADLYACVAGELGIRPMYDVVSALSPGVLVYATVLEDAVLYVMTSESAATAKIDVRDRTTGLRLTLDLHGQHAAMALIGRK